MSFIKTVTMGSPVLNGSAAALTVEYDSSTAGETISLWSSSGTIQPTTHVTSKGSHADTFNVILTVSGLPHFVQIGASIEVVPGSQSSATAIVEVK